MVQTGYVHVSPSHFLDSETSLKKKLCHCHVLSTFLDGYYDAPGRLLSFHTFHINISQLLKQQDFLSLSLLHWQHILGKKDECLRKKNFILKFTQQLNLQCFFSLLKRSRPVKKQMRSWSEGADSAIQNCFMHTDWEVFKTASSQGDQYTEEEYAEEVTSYIAQRMSL